MKKVIKSIFCLFIVVSLMISVFTFISSAAGTVIGFSNKSIGVGETLTVTLTFDAGEQFYAINAVINYDNNILEYKSGTAAEGGAGILKLAEATSGETKISYSLSFVAKATGSAKVSVTDCFYSAGEGDKPIQGASATVSVKDASLSSNARLKSLSVSAGKLSPKFTASRTSYTVSVKNSISECKIYATAADPNAKVDISENSPLEVGVNNRTITVTAPDGTTNIYKIAITRRETDDPDEPVDENETPENQTINTTVNDINYTVSTDLSTAPIFKGFSLSEAVINNVTVPVSVDENSYFKLFYLKSETSDALIPHTYDEETETFTEVNYFTQGEINYIFADIPENYKLPSGFYPTNLELAGKTIECFGNSNGIANDFYYIYCFYDNKFEFYRYDSEQNVLQRYPEISLVKEKDETISNDVVEEEEQDFISKFKNLTTNSKIVLFGFAVVIIFVILLLILIIVKIVTKKREYQDEKDMFFSNDEFDNIKFDDFSLLTEEESQEESDNNQTQIDEN